MSETKKKTSKKVQEQTNNAQNKKRNKIIAWVLSGVAAVLAVVITLVCIIPNVKPLDSFLQTINTIESTEKINNPDQGFYRPIYVKMTEDGATFNKNIVTANTQLYHLRADISAFSGAVNGKGDKNISAAALNGLNELLTYLKQSGKSAIVRFAYDPGYGGAKDQEPAQKTINKHIQQICKVLNKYQTTISAIEAGLVGPWGEMHSSAIANAEHINQIMEQFLMHTSGIPILVRTPKMIYNYLGITINDIDTYKITPQDKAYWLGLFNDGYLGSSSDLGTFTNREKEIAFLSQLTNHSPYGGEVTIPNSPLHDIETCLPEMHDVNLSYLNIEWNNQVVDKWKNTTYTAACGDDAIYYGKSAFTYIENHMGYRFVVTESVFEYNKDFYRFNVKLKLNNVGFGNLNRKKLAKLVFVNESGEVALTKKVENFEGMATETYSTKLKLANGNYDVYLCVYGEEIDGKPAYALQFANDGMWNADLQANKIGAINVQK